jgi:hypothetical protein
MSELEDLLAKADDLGAWRNAVIREQVIRDTMTQTGEDRQTAADFFDAHKSMDQEAVLELTSGAPTTLADGLQAYIEGLDTQATEMHPDRVASDLHALLTYPWPGEDAV